MRIYFPTAMACPENMEYKDCGDPCEPTCMDPQGEDCEAMDHCEEGCFCKKGLVWDGTSKCVDKDECGCSHNGAYYMVSNDVH